MAGVKQLRSWFFTITSVLRADGTTGGVRLRKTDKPTQQTFENLLESTAFKTESGDRARVSTGATVGSEQGLAVLASDVQAKANAAQLADRSLVTQPHQLPTLETIANSATEDMPTTGLFVQTGASSSRNQYQIRFLGAWLTWLISRIFKAGGVEGDVPIKTNGTDYNWSWANVGNNTTTVNAIANNATFISTLTNSATFATSLQTTITNIITSSPAFFTETLEVGFMRLHPATAIPSAKWVRCDGTSYATATYPALFALIGYTYGGAGANFNVPDLRDRQATGYSGTKTIGSTGGADSYLIDDTKLPVTSPYTLNDPGHTHDITLAVEAPPVNAVFSNGTSAVVAGAGTDVLDPLTTKDINTVVGNIIPSATDSETTGITVNTNAGGGNNLTTMDKYIALNIIIKVLP